MWRKEKIGETKKNIFLNKMIKYDNILKLIFEKEKLIIFLVKKIGV